jgi:hypothetical protein
MRIPRFKFVDLVVMVSLYGYTAKGAEEQVLVGSWDSDYQGVYGVNSAFDQQFQNTLDTGTALAWI